MSRGALVGKPGSRGGRDYYHVCQPGRRTRQEADMRKLTHAIPALVLVAAGAGLVLAGVTEVRAMSDPPARQPQQIHQVTGVDATFADMHQYLRLHRTCTETGRWNEWPCDQFSPAERP